MGETISERCAYRSKHGEVGAFLARPVEGAPWPAVLVIHDRQGLWEHMEDTARRFAAEGYLALAVDLYSRDEVRVSLKIDDTLAASSILNLPDFEAALSQFPADRQPEIRRAANWFKNRTSETHLDDLLAGIAHLKSRSDVRAQAVAVMGYCLGGTRVADVVGYGADIGAAVIYYGSFAKSEEQIPKIRCPVQAHHGTLDKRITERVPAIAETMRANGKDYTPYIYEDAPHAFANKWAKSYRPEATRLAWERTLEFLQSHLKGKAATPK